MKCPIFALGALVLFVAPVFAAPAAEHETMVFRMFDISTIVAPHTSEISPRLGPLNRHSSSFEVPQKMEPRRLMEGDALGDLIRTAIAPDTWNKGASLVFKKGGVLLVRNTPEACAKIAELLKSLDQKAAQRVALSVKLYELPAKAYDEIAAGADPAALEKAKPKLLESGSIEVAPGVVKILRILDRVRYVADYDVEIAQDSALSDPIVVSENEGLSVELCARPTLDGSRIVLSAVTQSGKFERPFRTLELGMDEEAFAHPYRSDRHYQNGRLELPVYDEQDSSVTALLADGQALTVPILRSGKLFVLRIEPTLATRGNLPWIFDLGSFADTRGVPWFGFPREVEPSTVPLLSPGLNAVMPTLIGPRFGAPESIMDLLTSNVDPQIWSGNHASLFVSGSDRLVFHGPQELEEKIAGFLKTLEEESLRFLNFDLRVYSVPGAVTAGEGKAVPQGAQLLYAARLTTQNGIRTGVEAGSKAAYLADYDAEVAQDSRIADPIVGHAFDGLVANLTPTLNLDRSRVEIDLEMLLAHRGPIRKFSTGTQYLGPIDHFDVARAILNQTFDVAVNSSYTIDGGPDPRTPGRRIAVVIENHLRK